MRNNYYLLFLCPEKNRVDYVQPEDFLDTTYCSADVLQRLMDLKLTIRKCETRFYDIRHKANSFADIGKNPDGGPLFHNPEAIKIANIDAMTGYQLTQPRDGSGCNLINRNEPLYFVDLCGGKSFITLLMKM